MSSSAQDEFDRLFNNKEKFSSHPEDRDNTSDLESSEEDESHRHTVDRYTHSDSEDDNMVSRTTTATSNYRIPNTVYDANTGPKGVIADAQAFERARKSSFRRTFGMDFCSHSAKENNNNNNRTTTLKDNNNIGSKSDDNEDDDNDDNEERFMRKWRETRMQELQNRSLGRRYSPRRKMYGFLETVDAEGYLDAIEKAPSDATVVVCIYDPDSNASAIVEDSLSTISRRQPSTRFVKLHHEIAEMDHIEAPALLAYRGGDVFATVVDIFRHLPKGRNCSADSLEDLLKLNRVL